MKLAGNGIAVRPLLVAIGALLRSVHPHKMREYLDTV